jgi:ammonium transporter Rh
VKAFDVGGSMTIHAFGAYGGLTVSLILGAMIKPTKKPETSYYSNLFALIGTLFLWMYWPSFNFGAFSTTAFTKTQIIGNTIFALTGSCLGTFATSAYVKDKFTM